MAIHLKYLSRSPYQTQPKLKLHFPIPLQSTTLQVNAVIGGKAQELIKSGKVRPIRPKEAALAIDKEGYLLLDIRPEWEREKARVSGSLHVPLFVEDPDNGVITLLKKWVHFGYIGLWTGQSFTMINTKFVEQVEMKVPDKSTKLLVACGEGLRFTTTNTKFVEQVEMKVPDKSTKLLVACGEGLRSMVAVTKLHKEGYSNIGWLAGGFNQSKDEDFASVEGSEKLQYATIGGASYYFLKVLLVLQAGGNNKS